VPLKSSICTLTNTHVVGGAAVACSLLDIDRRLVDLHEPIGLAVGEDEGQQALKLKRVCKCVASFLLTNREASL